MKKESLLVKESIINSIKERIEEIEPNLENLDSKDFNSLTTVELILKDLAKM